MLKVSDSHLKANVSNSATSPDSWAVFLWFSTLPMGNLGSLRPSLTQERVNFAPSQGKMNTCEPKKGLPVNFRSVYSLAWPGKPTDVAAVPPEDDTFPLRGETKCSPLPWKAALFLAFSLNLSFQGGKT